MPAVCSMIFMPWQRISHFKYLYSTSQMLRKISTCLLILITTGAANLFANPNSGSRPEGIRFTENKGQWDSKILFRADVPNGNLLVEKNALYYFLYSHDDLSHIHHPGSTEKVIVNGHAYKQEFVNANPNPALVPDKSFSDYANFYIGHNSANWASGAKIFGRVNYSQLYNGIDLSLYTSNNQLKYDLIAKPNSDVSQIKIRYNGVDAMNLKDGNLVIKTSVQDVIEEKPIAFQIVNGKKVEVLCRYVLLGNELSFEFPDGYNKNYDLTIDPNIVFSSYTGSTADNWGYTATYDNQGSMYVGGYVNATPPGGGNYPTTIGAFQAVWGGGTGGNNGNGNGIAFSCDMGISKFSPDGSTLEYSTYLGGNDNDTPHSMVVDAQGNLLVYGVSYSANYPVSNNAYDNTYNGNGDIVVTKFNAAGTALLGSTFLGGSNMDGINFEPQEFTSGNLKRNYGDQNRGEINIDAAGNIYVASVTFSSDFPVTAGALQATFGGVQDGCAFKLNSDCSQLVWCTYLGGSSDDACYSLDIGPNGTLYVAGGTMSNNFPTTAGSFHSTYRGGQYDGFVAHINATGTQLLSSTYIGTAGNDQVYFVKLDGAGNVYFVGQTTGSYPVVNAPYSNPNSGQFIAKLNPALNSVFYSTVFGSGIGQPNISPTAFLVDTCQNVYVAGWGTNSGAFASFQNNMLNMPLSNDAYQRTTDGTDFYFFVLSKNAQGMLYGSYFGGNGAIEHVDGGTSRFDRAGVIYQAMCAGCGGNSRTPSTPGSWSPTNRSSNCNLLGLKMEFNLSGTRVNINASPRATGCVPLNVQFNSAGSNAPILLWYFGDGGTSSVSNPTHLYTDTGTFRVMLVGIDSNSCNVSDTAYLDVWVRNDTISANFSPDIFIDCDSNKLVLYSPNYLTTQYQWNFGDGNTSTRDTAIHYYQNAGTYNITLIVSDSSRCNLRDTFSTPIVIPSRLSASFNISDSTGCAPLTVRFNIPPNPNAMYQWDFADGTSSTQRNPTHIFQTGGIYRVRLIVFDSTSCNIADTAYSIISPYDSAADARFIFTRTFYSCDSLLVTAWSNYQGADSQWWDFGDGTTSTADTVTHVYTTAGTFTLTHYVTDLDKICKPNDTARVAFSLQPLNISITVPDTGGCLPFTANFIGNSQLFTTDFYWFFGDGDSAQGSPVQHTYNSVGTFYVNVLAVDTNACSSVDTSSAIITVIDDFVRADFDINILQQCDSILSITLNNLSVDALEYSWSFGDGTSSSATNPAHSYFNPGTYFITLVATDTNRCHPVDSITKPVQLKPNTTLNFTAQNVCSGYPVRFDNFGSTTAQYNWSFGDGTSTQLYEPMHLYTSAGTYTVTLFMYDTTTCNLYDTASIDITVFAQPVAAFDMPADTIKYGTPVDFVNRSYNHTNSVWKFGDGTTSTEVNPTHDYKGIGNFRVCLTVYNLQSSCFDTICKNLFISYKGLIGVPNAFSPNGDGINDVVKIEGKGIVELKFRIYNRWGELVFETDNPNVGWDGTYKGVPQEMEAYTYTVDAVLVNQQRVPLKGNITLLR
jgi:gliding motility-associated-like protein